VTRGFVGALRCVSPKLTALVKRFRRTLRVLLPLEQPQTPRRIGRLLKQLRQKRIWGCASLGRVMWHWGFRVNVTRKLICPLPMQPLRKPSSAGTRCWLRGVAALVQPWCSYTSHIRCADVIMNAFLHRVKLASVSMISDPRRDYDSSRFTSGPRSNTPGHIHTHQILCNLLEELFSQRE
jgi:hypothetical protein